SADTNELCDGPVNEYWSNETMAVVISLLVTTPWQIRRVEAGAVRVRDAGGLPPTIPFWLGEAPARSEELSDEVSRLRVRVGAFLEEGDLAGAVAWLEAHAGAPRPAAEQIARYLDAARAALGRLPTRDDIVVGRSSDETGGMQLVEHAPFGGRVNRALGLARRKRICRRFDFELQAAANDDAVVLSLGPQHGFPLADFEHVLRPQALDETLAQAALLSPMFTAPWRWNLRRSL